MSTALALIPWWRRWLPATWFRGPPPAETRLVSETAHKAGADFAAAHPVEPGYSVEQAMSAFAALPWVYTCATAIANDVASIPAWAYIGRRKGAEALPESDRLMRLLNQPNSQTSPGQMYRQRVIDRLLTGNSYRRLLGFGATPSSLIRLHPERIRAVPARNGLVSHWMWTWEGQQALAVDEVLWDHGPSWEDGPMGLYGQGMIRALHHILTADEAAWERQAQAQTRGRPDAILTPNGEDGNLNDKQVKDLSDLVEKVFGARHGGVAVFGEQLKLDMLSWRPDHLGSQGIHESVGQVVRSAAGVPNARVGLPSQDPDAELLWYYQNTILPLAMEFDETDTRLAQRFDARAWVEHDFSTIAALQPQRTGRQTRIKGWVEMGYDVQTACEIEGLFGMPEPVNEPMMTPGSKPMDGVDKKKKPSPAPAPDADPAPLENAARWLATPPDEANRELAAEWLTEGGAPQQ